jgi:hypothetical protein
VRPDGYVAWRAGESEAGNLTDVLVRILGR